MIRLHEAKALIDETVEALDPQDIPIQDAVGCVIAEDICSPIDIPGFANSAMDGIALRYEDLTGEGPWTFQLQEIIAAGNQSPLDLLPGHAARIMTGAPLPNNADHVIPVEELTFRDGQVVVAEKGPPGGHIRPRGDDVKKDDCLFQKSETLKAVDVGILAALGLQTVNVIPRPKIAVLATGSEIVPPGTALEHGQIYNSNDASLNALLRHDEFTSVTILPPARDDMAVLTDVIRTMLSDHDIIITSGGVSMGDFDFIPEVAEEIGGEIIFHKVKVKPGKPVFMARFNEPVNKWLIGLPGNPVSVVVGYHLYVKRVLARLMGKPPPHKYVNARLTEDIQLSGKRDMVIGVCIRYDADGALAFPAVRQRSGRLTSIKGIEGFIIASSDDKLLKAGCEVQVELL